MHRGRNFLALLLKTLNMRDAFLYKILHNGYEKFVRQNEIRLKGYRRNGVFD